MPDLRTDHRIDLEFDDNRLAARLFGEHDRNLQRIETRLNVRLVNRGNTLSILGEEQAAVSAKTVLESLWQRVKSGQGVATADVDSALRMAAFPAAAVAAEELTIKTQRRVITARTPTQAHYIAALNSSDLTLGIGPAGTGKTYLAVAEAVVMMMAGSIDRIVLTRPAVEAGERLGFLPGDLKEKIDPYLRPLYDALHDMMPAEQIQKRMENGEIEVAPLAFMRGRTLSHSFIILDEAQNTTTMQMKMFLTRLGEGSRMVVTGDPTQIDLPPGQKSGLVEAMTILKNVEGVEIIRFTEADVVRHDLVARIVHAYDEHAEDQRRPRSTYDE
jgi:phosphate starvation-inducible protein PhoH and related proteins